MMSKRENAIGLYTGTKAEAASPMMTWKGMLAKQAKGGRVGDAAYKAIIESSQRSRGSVNDSVIGDEKCEDVLAIVDKKFGCR